MLAVKILNRIGSVFYGWRYQMNEIVIKSGFTLLACVNSESFHDFNNVKQ